MTWLGHASVLAEVDGKTILTDPIFSYRASLVQVYIDHIFSYRASLVQVYIDHIFSYRYRPAPCNIDDLQPLYIYSSFPDLLDIDLPPSK